MNAGGSLDEIITPFEMQHLISTLERIDVPLYGSKEWLKHHEKLEKLNNQGHRNAMNNDERAMVEDFLSGCDAGVNQVDTLIYDLLVAEAWKDNVFPLIKSKLKKDQSLKIYMMLYHEATVINLIEILMFHRDTIEESQDSVLELIDYCYRKLVWLANLGDNGPKDLEGKEMIGQTQEQELKRQFLEIEFSIAIICLSIIRFISDNLSTLNVPIVHQMMEVNDIPCILVPLMEQKPWIRKNNRGERELYEDQKWQEKKDLHTISKVEAQIWLTIYSMFMCQDTQRKYEITTFRKSNLLRLRKFMNEVLLDQLPVLTPMLRAFEELSMMQETTIPSSNPFVVQVIPEIRDSILSNKDWKAIANYQIENYFAKTDSEAREELQDIMKLYSSDMLEDFLDQPKCGHCGKEAKNRCSKCKHEWYCGRDCQIKGWKGHKKLCSLLAQSISEDAKLKSEKKKEQKVKEEEKEAKTLIQELKSIPTSAPSPKPVSKEPEVPPSTKESKETKSIPEPTVTETAPVETSKAPEKDTNSDEDSIDFDEVD